VCAVNGAGSAAFNRGAESSTVASCGEGIEVRFWGVRGTRAVPGPSTLRYGGNTSCVELRCGNEHLVLDAGTGITALGDALDPLAPPRNWHLFLSHTHHDHINGFPFFWPAYGDRHSIQLWAGHLLRRQTRLRDVLAHLMHEPYFPMPLERMHACRAFHDFEAGDELRPGRGIRVLTAPLNHPGGATGYRIEYRGRSVCYVTDVEHREGQLDPVVLELIQGSDLVIYDSTFTDEEYPRLRGWGHSTWQEGVRLCEAAGAGRLVLFHHHASRSDDALDALAADVDRPRPGSLVAREGLALRVLSGLDPAPACATVPPCHRPTAGRRERDVTSEPAHA
jgi:phosphoribosyl 1,2-cyclic phosphodiesterase